MLMHRVNGKVVFENWVKTDYVSDTLTRGGVGVIGGNFGTFGSSSQKFLAEWERWNC